MAWGPRPNKLGVLLPMFDGGLNSKESQFTTPLNDAYDLKNVEFDDAGAVRTVNGYSEWTTSALSNNRIDGLHSYVDDDGTRYVLVVTGGDLWYSTDTGTTGTFTKVTESIGLFTTGTKVKMFTIENMVIICNGNSTSYRFQDGNFYELGVNAIGVGSFNVASGAAGNLLGDYKWAITGINGNGVESDYTVLNSVALTLTNEQADLTNIPVFDNIADVQSRKLYRTKGDDTAYYLLTTLNTTDTSYTDNTADASLGVSTPPSDNATIPKAKYLCENLGYVFSAGNPDEPTRLTWSSVSEPEIWPTENFLEIGDGDGLPINGIRTYGNTIVISKSDGRSLGVLWTLYMPDSTGATGSENWYLTKSPSAYGGMSDRGMGFFSDLMYFVNKKGIYAFDGEDIALNPADSKVGRYAVDEFSYKIEPEWQNINPDELDEIAAITYDQKVWVSVPSGASQTDNNRLLVYDYSTASQPDRHYGAWSVVHSPGVSCFTEHSGRLLAGSSNDDGKIWLLDRDDYYLQNSDGIDSYFWTAFISGSPEHRNFDKVWRWLFLTVETTGNWYLRVTYRDDPDSSGNYTQISLDPDAINWGEMIWSVDRWGAGRNSKRVRIPLRGMVSKYIQFQFRIDGEGYTDQRWWKVYEAEIKYNLRRDR